MVGEDRVFVKLDDSATAIIEVTGGEGGLTVTRVHEGRGLHRSYSPPTLWGGQAYGYTNHWDSTDFASWRNRANVLLESLFPIDGASGSPGLAVWSTGQPGTRPAQRAAESPASVPPAAP